MGARAIQSIFALVLAVVAWPLGEASATLRDVTGVGVTATLGVASQYMTDGFKIGDSEPVLQPGLSVDVFSTGLSLLLWSSLRIDRMSQRYDEFDLFVRYSHDFFSDERWSFNLHGFAAYWFYPNSERVELDDFARPFTVPPMRGNKLHAGVSLPRLIPLDGWHIVPAYNVYYWLYWDQDRSDRFMGGARHELKAHYHHDVPAVIPGTQAHYVGVSASTNYNDGAFGVKPGWSHSNLQAGTSVYALGFIVSASVERQWTHNPDVNEPNELWTTLIIERDL